MQFLINYYTTEGRVKKVNQDAIFIMQADTDMGPVLFAAVSDGMGGLARGEEASARMNRALAEWFEKELPDLIYDDFNMNQFKKSMMKTIYSACSEIMKYANGFGAECGTTLVGILIFEHNGYIVNVGDSRVYIKHDHLRQITKDQTYVQREIDLGRMTEEEAKNHKMRSILLQCVGASDVVIPDWYQEEVRPGDVILLCSDGFRHIVSLETMDKLFNLSDDQMEVVLKTIAEKSMQAGERDNISAILIKAVDYA